MHKIIRKHSQSYLVISVVVYPLGLAAARSGKAISRDLAAFSTNINTFVISKLLTATSVQTYLSYSIDSIQSC